MTGRSVPEWIGATPDAKPPARIRLRVFRTANGICHISGRKIEAGEPWDLEHVIPLSMGGGNRENNLRPALRDKHRAKTAIEATGRAKADAAAKHHLGVRRTRPVVKIKSRDMPISERTAAREKKPPAEGLTGIARRFR